LRANPPTFATGSQRYWSLRDQGIAGSSNRLPVLDGIRAVAITFVLAGHSMHESVSVSPMLGTFGVSVFFVLSGYLITRTMLADERIHGRLRIGNFYRRRALRIFPAFYAFLIILWGLTALGRLPMPDKTTWLASIFYFRNLAGSGLETGHLWTLSLEEQFYLFWPALFVLMRRRRLAFIAAVVIVSTVWRAMWLHEQVGHVIELTRPGGYYWRTDFRMDTFLIGGAFAIADWEWVKTAPVYLAWLVLPVWVSSAIGVSYLAPLDTAVTAFIVAMSIGWLVANPGCRAARVLAWRAAVVAGVLSYSIYLWQQLFLVPFAHLTAWNYVGVGVTACGSYWLVERPFLGLRDRGKAAAAREPRLVGVDGSR
jgi:peptidoglycan/LPS O-acetylase OafA/YrhL